jgi:hypothetical protein
MRADLPVMRLQPIENRPLGSGIALLRYRVTGAAS